MANVKWTYKNHMITPTRGGYRITGADGKKWLGTRNWTLTLQRISRAVNKEIAK